MASMAILSVILVAARKRFRTSAVMALSFSIERYAKALFLMDLQRSSSPSSLHRIT